MGDGFFELPTTPKGKQKPKKAELSCASCGLDGGVLSPRMEPFGDFKKGILNIGEAPGKVEDEKGKPWQGRAGRALQAAYEELSVDLFSDCLNINAVSCRPTDTQGNNRPPSSREIACCRQRIFKVIDEIKPRVIILLGGIAVEAFLNHRWRKDLGGITRWRGWTIPDQDYNAWVCPVFHPSYVERSEDMPQVRIVWMQDLEKVFGMVGEFFPNHRASVEDRVKIIEDLTTLDEYHRDTWVAIDYETTGIKPHADGHRIICAAVATELQSYAFMMPETKKGRQPFLDLLAAEHVGKVAHNMKFEQAWSEIRLKQPVNSWVWDTILSAHVLDNRAGITGLKFQVYVNFGVVDYSSGVSSYLETGDNDGNGKNKILDLIATPGGRNELLTYCGQDALFTAWLAKRHMEKILIDNSGA